MVGEDIDLLFDILDTDVKGYLTVEEIQLFDETTFFDALDLVQIEAALISVCGVSAKKCCFKTNFKSLLKELERRRVLEEKVKWDFNALDGDRNGRISLQSALFLFKSVHVERFSTRLWNKFLSSRVRPEAEVSYDEIRMFLCNVPEESSSDKEDFLQYSIQVKNSQIDRDYNLHQSLVAWQEDETALVAKEREKQFRSGNLKQSADHLVQRIDDIGIQALLEEDDGIRELTEQPCERVNATDLLNALKDKYDKVRDHLLFEMLKIQVGEGMLAALSVREQNERLFQVKVKEEGLRKEGREEEMAVQLPGSRSKYDFTLLWLMGESSAAEMIKEQEIKDKMAESGLEYDEVKEEMEKKIKFEESQQVTTDQVLIQLNKRLHLERETVSNRLRGIGSYSLLNSVEREHLFCLLFMMQLRASNEQNFEAASIFVGLTERISANQSDILSKDRKRHQQLAKKRLLVRKGLTPKNEKDRFTPIIQKSKAKRGRIDLQMEIVQNMEKRLLFEREIFIHFLQGRDSLQFRVNAKKLNSDERSNQLLVLKTQWQGWHHRSTEDKLQSIEQHRALLQEAVSIVFETKKEELRLLSPSAVDDLTVACNLLCDLQLSQEAECKSIINFHEKNMTDLERVCSHEVKSCEEEWFENIASVIFGIKDVSDEEEELVKALNDKYDAVRDKLLLEALKKQMSDAEWAKLSEQERQARLMKLKLMERRLRRDGKYDQAAALLGDAMKNAEFLQSLLGENRQRYLDKIQERLKARKKKVLEGEIDEDDEELMEDDENISSGNILKDLQMRYEQEKDALLRRLQEGEGRLLNEKERQAELMRLRIEKRKAEREGNFEGAALVLGIAERNNTAREEGLKKDRERQEKLARERLEARRNAQKRRKKEEESPEPSKDDDISVWQDSVMKELEKKQIKEREVLAELLNDSDMEDLYDEAKNMTSEERMQRISKLKDKREELDFEDSSDQEEHGAILEMAASVKVVIREEFIAQSSGVTPDDVNLSDVAVSLLADLQEVQDKETAKMIEELQNKSQEELATLRTRQIKSRNYEELSNVAEVIFTYEGKGSDKEIIKALDKKYDALMDKLILEGLQKQLGDAEWKAMSEQERQAEIIKRRLEQKRLMRDGKLEEAAKLLGEGFQTDASLKKLMGQNRARYEEMVKEKLARRRERHKQGLEADEDDDLEIDESAFENEVGHMDAKSILADMQSRYEDEKEALMSKLKGADAKFYTERERQAELARLRREQRKVKLEEKFGTAAMVLGLAERNQANLESKMKSDRARQEQLAKERLEKMRLKKKSKQKEMTLVKDGDEAKLRETAMEYIEHRHTLEREALVELFKLERPDEVKKAECMTTGNREERLKEIKQALLDQIDTVEESNWQEILSEMAILKELNRQKKLKSGSEAEETSRNDVIVSLIADLQEAQDKESDQNMEKLEKMGRDELIAVQEKELEAQKSSRWQNLIVVLAEPENSKKADDDVLVDALSSKYEVLKDKLIFNALQKKLGDEEWNQLSEEEKHDKLMEIKLQMKTLAEQGKQEELNALMADLFPDDGDMDQSLMINSVEWDKRMEERERLRRERKEAGMSDEEIDELEKKEDELFEEKMKKESSKNTLLNLEQNFEAEKDALLASLRGANAKLMSERERQAELARLKREQRKARKEDNFESAALVLSLAKTQQTTLENKMKSDRERQEKLAKERLLARRNRRNQTKNEEEMVDLEETDNINKLQENVVNEMESKHGEERDFLLEIIQKSPDSVYQKKAKDLDIVSRQQRINELKAARVHWRESSKSEMMETQGQQRELFSEAVSLKIQMILDEISPASGGSEDDDTLQRASVSILADLQQSQDKEAEYLLKDLSKKHLMTLKQLHKVQRMARIEKWYDNVASGVLGINRLLGGPPKVSENDVVDALGSKYDELKEKLFIDILKRKFGDSEWEKMTKEEQQHQLELLREEEIKLRNGEEVENSVLKEFSEDQSQETADLLKNMQNQYEAEKDAILASLKGADAKLMGERERQAALFKLRREKRMLQREDKFESAAIIFNMAEQNRKVQDTSYKAERARQKELAMKRLEAIRRMKAEKFKTLDEKILEDQQKDIDEDIKAVDTIEREGTMAAKNIVLEEMEKKHFSEREALMGLMSKADADEAGKAAANYLTKNERDEKIANIRKERETWKQSSLNATSKQPLDSEMTEEEKKANASRIAESWKEHEQMLIKALILKSEEMKNTLIADGVSHESIPGEISVLLLADLQEKQNSENNAINTVIDEKKRDFLMKVRDEQRKRRRENWMENVANLLLGSPPAVSARKQSSSKAPDMSGISEEMENVEEMLEEEEREKFAKLDEEIEKEKQKRNHQELSEEEMSRLMAELQKQQDTKKQAILASIEKQRADAKRRLEEKRRKRDEKQYEEDVTLSIVNTANQRSTMMREKTILQKRSQQDSLEDRLRLRKEERKRKAEREAQKLKEEEEEEQRLKNERAKKAMQLPGGGLRREKTVVEEAAEMDDSEKKEIVGVLMREQTTIALRLNREQTRQEEMVKLIRSKRKQRKEQIEQEAATIVSIGERQKTIVASQTKSERERQIASVRDRVARIKYERTITMKEPKDPNAAGFDKLLDNKETEGLTEDEKMAKVARKMEQKLKQEAVQKDGNASLEQSSKEEDGSVGDETMTSSHGGGKLDEKMKVQIMKDRYLQKKKSRKNKSEKSADEKTSDE